MELTLLLPVTSKTVGRKVSGVVCRSTGGTLLLCN